jgi:hypothetical protein
LGVGDGSPLQEYKKKQLGEKKKESRIIDGKQKTRDGFT